ncbi:hypothetical protein DM828_22265 [Pseudomonas umsongensis]|nr:hypothetical protein [Pseudomonas umsongensis]
MIRKKGLHLQAIFVREDPINSPQPPVGAGLPAKRPVLSTGMPTGRAPSRASPLPQRYASLSSSCLDHSISIGPLVPASLSVQ